MNLPIFGLYIIAFGLYIIPWLIKHDTFFLVNEPKINSEQLSLDEEQVADLLLLGFSQTKIGKKLKMTNKEVKTHCSLIRIKRGCKTTKELLDKGSAFVFGKGTSGK